MKHLTLGTKENQRRNNRKWKCRFQMLIQTPVSLPLSFQNELQLPSLDIHIQTLPKLPLWMRVVAGTSLFFFYSQMHQKTIRKAKWFIVMEWNAIHKCFFHSNLSLIVLKPLQKMCLKEPFDISMIKNIMQLNNPITLLYVIWAGPWVTTSFNPDKWLLLTEGCHSARCLR